MANTLFNNGREGFLRGEISWNVGVIKCYLVRGYTLNLAHKFVSEVTAAGGTLAATSPALANKTTTSGVADADDVTFTSVPANASNHYVIFAQTSAVTGGADVATSAQRLIGWMDTGTNIPAVPNGGNVIISFDNTTNKIFKL